MITGAMRNLEGIIKLEVAGPGSQARKVEALIDTGYNGYITLPDDQVTVLQLPFAGHRRARLADGTVILLNMYQAEITWHGRQRNVLVSQAEGPSLIGMSTLRGSRLVMDVVDGGDVTIDELS